MATGWFYHGNSVVLFHFGFPFHPIGVWGVICYIFQIKEATEYIFCCAKNYFLCFEASVKQILYPDFHPQNDQTHYCTDQVEDKVDCYQIKSRASRVGFLCPIK